MVGDLLSWPSFRLFQTIFTFPVPEICHFLVFFGSYARDLKRRVPDTFVLLVAESERLVHLHSCCTSSTREHTRAYTTYFLRLPSIELRKSCATKTSRPSVRLSTFERNTASFAFKNMYSQALTVLALCTTLAVNTVSAISKISVVGSKFFTDEGNQFYLKGGLPLLSMLCCALMCP